MTYSLYLDIYSLCQITSKQAKAHGLQSTETRSYHNYCQLTA